ncbi:MAG: aspartate 1-decarboxylase [Alphaproteobacteria bacterium]|nr:aspartate 1-decarboxylase [Alphaproteobacteria bacterium]
MLIKQLKCKIHRARLTKVDLEYEGSLSIDKNLIKAAGLEPYEAIHVWNVNNGMRLETYVIEAPAGSGELGLNGAAARGAAVGDVLIIAAWGWRNAGEKAEPVVVLVDENNQVSQAVKKT